MHALRLGDARAGRAPNTADATGGYYQPLRVALAPDDLTLVRHRIRCALPNVPLAAARDFNRDYVPNRAPRIAAIRAFAPDGEVELSSLPPTAELTFQVEVANDAREPYLRYDPRAGALTTAQERLSLAWYITSGAFDHPLLVVAQLTVENRWHTEDLRAGAWLWVVLRDDRGGIAVESRELSRVLCSPEPCTRTSARLSIRP